jgi:hypothetical protein
MIVQKREPGAANSRATINWNDKINDLGLLLGSPIGSITAVPEKETFTCKLFVEKVLSDFRKEWVETRPKKRTCHIFLYLDNAPTDRGDGDFDLLETIKLFHLPYSQDIA